MLMVRAIRSQGNQVEFVPANEVAQLELNSRALTSFTAQQLDEAAQRCGGDVFLVGGGDELVAKELAAWMAPVTIH